MIMTMPRQVIRGGVYMLTRRCTQRQFLLRPDPHVENVYSFLLASAAQRFGVVLIAWTAMSDHKHEIIHDPDGRFPEFMEYLNTMLARTLNCHWGRWESLWAGEQPNVVRLLDKETQLEKVVYVLTNPVSAGLVERVVDWPGASSFALNITGRERVVDRPEGFFRKDGPTPERVTLRAGRLPGFADLSEAEWQQQVREAVESREKVLKEQRQRNGRRVVGRKAVLAASHLDSPSTLERRRTLRPTIACKDPERRKMELGAVRAFRAAYRVARELWIAGDRDVLFPVGTYLMRVVFGVAVGPPPAIAAVA
jgi:REP element-mobilizing transposase RayT